MKYLDGLSKFVTFGTLNVSSNDLNWNEMEKIRHLHIVDLIAVNNPKLDKDLYCKCKSHLFSKNHQ